MGGLGRIGAYRVPEGAGVVLELECPLEVVADVGLAGTGSDSDDFLSDFDELLVRICRVFDVLEDVEEESSLDFAEDDDVDDDALDVDVAAADDDDDDNDLLEDLDL